MIYKNNEPYKLTKEEMKMYSKRVVYLLMPSMAKWDRADQRVRRPNSIQLEPFYTVFNDLDGQSTEIRYARTAPQQKTENNVTNTSWNPSQLEFPQSGKIVVDKNDPEMNFFWANHPLNEGNEKRDTKRTALFFPENRAALAAKAVKATQKRFDAISLIFHPTDGLDEKNLRIVASAYTDLVAHIQNPEFTLDQIKDALKRKAEADPDFFLKAARSPRTRIKHLLDAAIEAKLMRYIASRKQWVKVEDGADKDVMLTIRDREDAVERVIEFLMNEDKHGYKTYFETKLNREPVYQ